MTQKKYDLKKDERYLRLLAKSFPNIADAATEIINLEAIAHLPKGTEHFLADIMASIKRSNTCLKMPLVILRERLMSSLVKD